MNKEYGKDKIKFIKELNDFLDSEEKTVFITGLDDDAKISVVLKTLNKRYKYGIINCSCLGDIATLINGSLKSRLLPSKVRRTKIYKIGMMKIDFKKYISSNNPKKIGTDKDFVLYYPVQSVLSNYREKDLNSLILDISNTVSKKYLLLQQMTNN